MTGDTNTRASYLYEELARVRSLLDYYDLYPFGSMDDRASFIALADLLRQRENEIVKKLLQLQRREAQRD